MGMVRSDYVHLSVHRNLCVLDDSSLFWLARDLGTTIRWCCYHYDGAGDYVSPRHCLGDRAAEVYWLAFATAAGGGGGFTLGQYLSLTSLLSEQMRW